MALWRATRTYRAMPGPWLNQTVTDHNISRIGIFAVCCITLGAFYFGLLKLPISHLANGQQLPSLSNPLEVKRQPTAVVSAVATAAPSARPSQLASVEPAVLPPTTIVPAAAPAQPVVQPPASAKPAASVQPVASRPPAPAGYTVQAGDTLFSIARRHNVSVQSLTTANKLADAGTVRVGQKLDIP